uniref:Conotoxin TxMMSK-02 n=4 Tax=Conus TaxID=6490 RepID=M232_CONTE|nr:RecName: Full=Conotoxin TxMMSK-02; Flags: Precursor [Conus textile]AEX60280.1 M superfamily MMSK group conopeptide Cp+Ca+Rt+S+Eb+Vt+Tx3-WP03 [Conus capitaneus]AEX60303.1 M superfamily MMSK group conopeptide Rt+Ca+Ec+Eb+Vr+S+Tx+Vt3-WP01 [Conus rattus]DAZ85845.1 TPA_inf: conotoxin precursor M [Conus ebraeus]AAG60355.1 conotoxin scaffold III/IV precursor [Conus textile]DAZ85994.1 TPA_inf: conotoxin precursor M [Conus ebraeus]
MMSKLGALLTICLLLFSLTAVPLDGDQHADQPAQRLQDRIPTEDHPLFDPNKRCCDDSECSYSCWPCCYG